MLQTAVVKRHPIFSAGRTATKCTSLLPRCTLRPARKGNLARLSAQQQAATPLVLWQTGMSSLASNLLHPASRLTGCSATASSRQANEDEGASTQRSHECPNTDDPCTSLWEATHRDPAFRLLHLAVASVFASQLQRDRAVRERGEWQVSLVGKWAPSPAGAHDRTTLIATAVAQLLFPAETHRCAGETSAAFMQRIRMLYQREYLAPLRRHLKVPEVFMAAKRWHQLPYGRVPSICMKTNKGLFESHDGERFTTYLGKVRSGEKKIASGALKPHDLVQEAMGHTG
ncbi:hypothetical protein WJX72_005760 [[Myrmecia] bisecta]|uniref:DUF2828 domain-containing protein n=1 Tax=[Myrmecia] bisecta TaxID=41462 RepID=A0AAW1PTU4_9CHLO